MSANSSNQTKLQTEVGQGAYAGGGDGGAGGQNSVEGRLTQESKSAQTPESPLVGSKKVASEGAGQQTDNWELSVLEGQSFMVWRKAGVSSTALSVAEAVKASAKGYSESPLSRSVVVECANTKTDQLRVGRFALSTLPIDKLGRHLIQVQVGEKNLEEDFQEGSGDTSHTWIMLIHDFLNGWLLTQFQVSEALRQV
jgi:hypothetical protein